MTTQQSIVIVGAGVFGATAAVELRRRGYTVSLFDPGPLPHPLAASTDITKMIRMDYGQDELYIRMMEQAFAGWDRWNREWPRERYHEDGMLLLTREPMKPDSFEYRSYETLIKRGHALQRINSEMLRERFSLWNPDQWVDGYYNPRAGWAQSGEVVAQLVEIARATGVQLYEGKSLQGLLERGEKVIGIQTGDGDTYHADHVILAMGAWTPVFLPYLRVRMRVTGHPVLLFQPANPEHYRPPRFTPWTADIANTGWYGFVATSEGIVKVANHGAGRALHPDEPRIVGKEWEERCRAFLQEAIPELADAPLVGDRLCLYCDTWDGNFWIDHDPDRSGLVVAAGGSGHGFKFAPLLGEVIADVVERKPNPYKERFVWRLRGEAAKEEARSVN